MGFAAKLFLLVGASIAITLASAVLVATWRVGVATDRSIRADLRTVRTVFESFWSDAALRFTAVVRSLAEEPGTKALFAPGVGEETRYDWANNTSRLLEASVVFLIDRGALLLARSGGRSDAGTSFREVGWAAQPLHTREPAVAAIREGPNLAMVAAVPVVSGKGEDARVDGVLAVGFPLDRGRLLALAGMTRGEAGIIVNVAPPGEPVRLRVAAATDDLHGDEALAQLAARPTAIAAVFTRGDTVDGLEIEVRGQQRLVVAVPIKSAGGTPLGAFLVSRSREQESAAFGAVRNAVLAFGLVSMLVALPLAFVMGRRFARPLVRLAASAEAVRLGRLDVDLPAAGADEVGALARAFADMVKELREKVALERLVTELQTQQRRAAGSVPAGDPAPDLGEPLAGRYELLSLIGRGGMGTVYRARDRHLDEEVCLKVLSAEALTAHGMNVVETLKREIRLARKITHPNVARTHDLGQANDHWFLTMEFVPGTTLREIIHSQGPITLGPGMQIAKQLCRGLAAVHDAGIIHRDVKPANVMVLPHGLVKLMDFGVSIPVEVDAPQKVKLAIGTLSYMSPEQLRGDALTPACDIYGLGIVMFEMFAGVRPFEGDPESLPGKHLHEQPPSLTALRPDLPDRLDGIILACLAKEVRRRPPSAGDLHGALLRIAAAEEPT